MFIEWCGESETIPWSCWKFECDRKTHKTMIKVYDNLYCFFLHAFHLSFFSSFFLKSCCASLLSAKNNHDFSHIQRGAKKKMNKIPLSLLSRDGKYPISKVFDVWALFLLFVCRLTEHIIYLSSDSGVGVEKWIRWNCCMHFVDTGEAWIANRRFHPHCLHTNDAYFPAICKGITSIAKDDEWQNHRARQGREWERMEKQSEKAPHVHVVNQVEELLHWFAFFSSNLHPSHVCTLLAFLVVVDDTLHWCCCRLRRRKKLNGFTSGTESLS